MEIAAASGPGFSCRNHTAPHPPSGRAPRRDGLARGSGGRERSTRLRGLRVLLASLVVYSGCQAIPSSGPRTDLAAGDDGANRLLLCFLILEYRLGLGQADFLGRGGRMRHARVFDRGREQGRWAIASTPACGAGSDSARIVTSRLACCSARSHKHWRARPRPTCPPPVSKRVCKLRGRPKWRNTCSTSGTASSCRFIRCPACRHAQEIGRWARS